MVKMRSAETGKVRILVVDLQPGVSLADEHALAGVDADLIRTHTIEEARGRLDREQFTLILLHVSARDAQAVTQEIRRHHGAKDVPIVVLKSDDGSSAHPSGSAIWTLNPASQSDSLLAAVVESSQDAIVSNSLDGIIQTWNAGAERLFGYTAAEAIGRPITMLLPPELLEEEVEILTRLRRGDRIVSHETVRVRKDGSRVPIAVTLSPVLDADGRIIGASKIARDISGLKLAEADRARLLAREREARSIAEAAERRAQFLASASEILASSLEYEETVGRVVQLAVREIADCCSVELVGENGEFQQLAVAHRDPVKTEAIRDLHRRYAPDPNHPRGLAAVVRSRRSELHAEISEKDLEGFARDAEHLRLLKDLAPRSAMFVPLVARDRIIGVMTFLHAESRRRYEPHDLALAEDLGRRVALAIDSASLYRALREADRRKDDWLAMLAHELRNPMATILTSLHLVRAGHEDDGSMARAEEMMERQVRHLGRLVDDLLDVSRIAQGRVQIRRERLDLGQLVQNTATDRRAALERAGLRLVLELPETPLWIAGDPIRLTQVLNNLLDNAAKFKGSGDDVTVRLRTDTERNEAVLVVEDRGIGVAPEMMPLLFDLFSQADHTLDRTPGGLGVGLAVVKGLIALHSGTVTAESAGIGQGARFTVRLPVKNEPAALTDTPRKRPAKSDSLRILVVEDNKDAAHSLQMLLELLGHQVEVAYNGLEGVRKAHEWRPEVVLCDIGLPNCDGYEVAGELRRDPVTANARLIAVTGYGQESDRQRSHAAGFDYHLVKPVDPRVLLDLLIPARGPATS